MPVPLLVWIGLGVAAMVAAGSNSPARTDNTPTPPPTPPEPTPTPSELEPGGLMRPRTSKYEKFVTAYASTPYHNLIAQTEQEKGIPENLLARLIYAESSFNPNATSSTGDIGIAQFQPATAQDLGIDPTIPEEAIPAAGAYLASLAQMLDGDWYSALVAYNWGIGSVQKYGVGSAPRTTVNYAQGIIDDSELNA